MLLLPLRSYLLEYSKSRPRPLYPLDALILRAMQEAPFDTAAQIEQEFGLPRRVVIERLLRLLEEGYIAVRRANVGPLRLTRKATQWLADNRAGRRPELDNGKAMEFASARVLMERISGRLVRRDQQEVRPLTEGDLRSLQFPVTPHILPQWVEDDPWDEASARRLFKPKDRVEKILNLRPDPEILYWPVDVIPAQREVIGLPATWKHLEARVLDYAYMLGGTYHAVSFWDQRTKPAQEGARGSIPLDLRPEDILRSHQEVGVVLRAIAGEAKSGSTILIVTPDFDVAYFGEAWYALLLQFLRRGTNVDLLWNTRQKDPRAVRAIQESLRKLSEEAGSRGGAFAFNLTPAARCETSLFVASATGTGVEAIVGAPSWMSKVSEPWVAVRTQGSSTLVVELIGYAAALISRLWPAYSPTSSMEPSHWRELSSRLAALGHRPPAANGAAGVTFKCTAQLVRSYDFEPLAENLALHSRWQFTLNCESATKEAKRSLLHQPPPPETQDSNPEPMPSIAEANDGNVTIVEGRGFHILADDTCVLGGPPVFGQGRGHLQLGLMLHSRELARYLKGEDIGPPEDTASGEQNPADEA